MSTDPWADFRAGAGTPAPTPQGAPLPAPAQGGGVFIPAPGAAEEQARRGRDEARAQQSLGLSREDNARADRKETFGNAGDLRREFRAAPQYKNYETVIRQFSSALKTEPTPTGDQALITAYAKMLDPGSVVREQEFNVVAAGDSKIGQTVARLAKELGLEDSGMLRPEVRARVHREMLNLTGDYRRAYEQVRNDYAATASRNGLNVDDVLGAHLGDAYRSEIEKNWKPGGAGQSGRSELAVAKGGSFATDQDIEVARQLQDAWNSGATPDEMNALSQKLSGAPLSAEGLKTLRANEGRRVNIMPSSSGQREAGEQISGGIGGDIQSFAAGAVRGYTANMAEELAPLLGLQSEQVQAALDAYAEKNPVASFVGETGGSLLSPAAKIGGGGLAGTVTRDAIYGGIYGAGEGRPGATLEERALGAGVGALTGGAASYGASRLFKPKTPIDIGDGPVPGGPAPGDALAPAAGPPPGGGPAAAVAEEAIKEGAEEASPDGEQIGRLVRQAIGFGPGSSKAKLELARLAKVNPEAKAAADRLDVELPPDVVSDSARLSELVGMGRSQVGSDASEAWKGTLAEVSTRMGDALADLGATRDIAQASDDVLARLDGAMQSLQRQGDQLRREVDAVLDVRAPVEASNLQRALAEQINDMGGLDEAKKAFTAEERKLLVMLGEGGTAKTPTYARLNQLRDQIGRALNKNEGPWVDAPRANLAKYYAALADDQIAHIEAVAGPDIAEKMRGSNEVFTRMYKARGEMQELFGPALDKSLEPLLNRAIGQGKKGNAEAFNKLLARVPKDMHGGLLVSGLLSQAQSNAAHGGFSFANYVKAYRGLRENTPIYKKFAKAVGPEGDRILADVYAISRRMAEAEGNVHHTGKANQALIALTAERLSSRFLKGWSARAAGAAGGMATGGLDGGVTGGLLAHAVNDALTTGGRERLDKAHKVLSSPEFRGLVEKLGSEGEDAAVNRFARSKALRDWLPGRVKDPHQWVRSTMAVGASSALPEHPTVEIGQ